MRPPEETLHPMQPARPKELREAIADVQARLEALEAEQVKARTRLAALQSELTSLGDPSDTGVDSPPETIGRVPETPAEKVRLFRSLFRGRPDVFPTRFVSRRTGKAGYAPACRNKFVPGVCELPKIRCGECTNQAIHADQESARLLAEAIDYARQAQIAMLEP